MPRSRRTRSRFSLGPLTRTTAALQEPELRFAGSACCDVVASSHQVHGAVGFALETGLHVYHRRARSVHAWATAACDAAR